MFCLTSFANIDINILSRVENISLRMDDINQKENAMKLSMQTIDYRLAKLEDIAIKTAESLFTLQQVGLIKTII